MTTDELRSWMKALEERDVRIAALEKTVAALSRSEPPQNPPQHVYCDAQGREWRQGQTTVISFGGVAGGGAGGISSNTFGSSSGGVGGCGGEAFLPTPEEQIALCARSGLNPAQAIGYGSVVDMCSGVLNIPVTKAGNLPRAAFKACFEQGLFDERMLDVLGADWTSRLRANGWPL